MILLTNRRCSGPVDTLRPPPRVTCYIEHVLILAFGETLFILGSLSGLIVGGIGVTVATGARQKASAGLLLLILAIAGLRIYQDLASDYYPAISDDQVLAGRWCDSAGRDLRLTREHTFEFKEHGKTYQGTWRREEHDLFLTSSSSIYREMRVIKFQNRYRIIPEPYHSDTRDPWRALRRANPK